MSYAMNKSCEMYSEHVAAKTIAPGVGSGGTRLLTSYFDNTSA